MQQTDAARRRSCPSPAAPDKHGSGQAGRSAADDAASFITCTFDLACLQEILKQRGWEAEYPLFTTVNRIVSGYFPPTDIVNFKEV